MKRVGYMVILLISVFGCKKPYAPPAITAPSSYLVVEGVINAGADSTFIKLSRTVNISAKNAKNPEKNAILTVESDQNTTYQLTEIKPGYYASAALNLDAARKYRLRVKTANNKQYLSDFTVVQITPPIDSVGFIVQNNGIQLYANTHDPNNSTRYYRWDYNETWRFHAAYESTLITNGKAIVDRTPDQLTYYCFANDTSSTIVLGSSAKLKQDVIFQNPLTSVPSTSEKIEIKYSIQVHQYALTSDAYTFWQNLKKTTEELGSIFDPEPTQINGNIHNVNDPTEPVVGYISVSTVQTKRIFISHDQVPGSWNTVYPYSCVQDSLLYCRGTPCVDEVTPILIPLGSAEIPVNKILRDQITILGYTSADVYCTDCSLRGTKTQPPFWQP
jgi:hypothetical protein